MKNKRSAIDIARVLLSYPEVVYTPLKLQKILFYCEAFHLCFMDGESLFEDKIIARQWGPIIESVYDKYRAYGSYPIATFEPIENSKPILNSQSLSVIGLVLDAYGSLSASSLMRKTHAEDPWINAYGKGSDAEITRKVMLSYYKDFIEER